MHTPSLCARLGLSIAIALTSSVSAEAKPVPGPEQRPFTIDDMFTREDYQKGSARFSPDREALAFVKHRPESALRDMRHFQAQDYMARADVWIQRAPGETPVPITQGERDDSGWWSPTWSPDGQHVAMLSSRQNTHTLWLWSRDTNELRQLDSRGIVGTAVEGAFRWLDNEHLLYGVRTDGKPSDTFAVPMKRRMTEEALARFDAGKVSASVLSSGDPARPPSLPWLNAQLVVASVRSGQTRALMDPLPTLVAKVSPDDRTLAAWEFRSVAPPVAGEPMAGGLDYRGRFVLHVRAIAGRTFLTSDVWADAVPHSLSWSRDGQALSFWRTGEKGDAASLYRVDLDTVQLSRVELGTLQAVPGPNLWTSNGDVLVLAAESSANGTRHWWAIDRQGHKHRLTDQLPGVPEDLIPVADGSFAALHEGELWKIAADGSARNLTRTLSPKIAQTTLLNAAQSGNGRTHVLLLPQEPHKTAPAQYQIDLIEGVITPLRKSLPGTELVAFAPGPGIGHALYYSDDRQGSSLSRVSQGHHAQILFTANRFLSGVAEGAFRAIEYAGADGETLRGWVLLPPDYRAGRQYPLIVQIYPGTVYDQKPPALHQVRVSHFQNMQLAAARGYAVLFPSIPLNPWGQADDPMLRIKDNTLRAVDRVIALGIADPDRTFVAGHSFGGYAVNALVAQTDRFKAGLASAGVSDPISKYGQLASPPEMANSMIFWYYEAGQGGMGNPPWKDIERYVRNTPLLGVEKIHTPLLLVHGEADSTVTVTQSEEMFQALYRLGKRAELVRYAGEEHIYSSPENIRDLWRRQIAWFDEFGDLQRDAHGALEWDGSRVRSRKGH